MLASNQTSDSVAEPVVKSRTRGCLLSVLLLDYFDGSRQGQIPIWYWQSVEMHWYSWLCLFCFLFMYRALKGGFDTDCKTGFGILSCCCNIKKNGLPPGSHLLSLVICNSCVRGLWLTLIFLQNIPWIFFTRYHYVAVLARDSLNQCKLSVCSPQHLHTCQCAKLFPCVGWRNWGPQNDFLGIAIMKS